MKKKIKKLLLELTKNSRITTKELSRRLRTSQQAASYLVNRLKRKGWIQECNVVVDSVKLGFTNVLVGFDYTSFDRETIKEILDYFKSDGLVVTVEEASQGVDLFVEYSSSNLSAFNKAYFEAAEKFRKALKTKFVLPVIVKHKLQRNYLGKKRDEKDVILCGDRDIVRLLEKENLVLRELVRHPDARLVQISNAANIPVKSVAAIKKKLENKAIIRGYSCILDSQKFGIRRYHVLLKLNSPSAKDINSILAYARMNKNIIGLTKLIGPYHVLITVEELGKTGIIPAIREQFPIEEYLVVEISATHKKTYLPLAG